MEKGSSKNLNPPFLAFKMAQSLWPRTSFARLGGHSRSNRIKPAAKKYPIYEQIELTGNAAPIIVEKLDILAGHHIAREPAMTRGHRNAVVLTLMICALSPRIVLAKQHHKSHKPSIKTAGGTLSLETNSYQGLTSISGGSLLVASPSFSYPGLVINSGSEALIANSVGTLTLNNSYQNSASISYGTLTVSNTAALESSGTLVTNSAQVFSGSAGVLSLDLGNTAISAGTLLISNATNYSGTTDLLPLKQLVGSITLLTGSNFVIPSGEILETPGTLSVEAPEPTGLGLVAFAALAFLRRPSRK